MPEQSTMKLTCTLFGITFPKACCWYASSQSKIKWLLPLRNHYQLHSSVNYDPISMSTSYSWDRGGVLERILSYQQISTKRDWKRITIRRVEVKIMIKTRNKIVIEIMIRIRIKANLYSFIQIHKPCNCLIKCLWNRHYKQLSWTYHIQLSSLWFFIAQWYVLSLS